jgi:predicted regulator of Ras-like GTPase activity (Roadblock/LC7/MglB family)
VLEILKELNSTPGVRGSAVVMEDGVVMSALLAAGSDADSFAALISSLLSHVRRNAQKMELGNIKKMLVTSSRGCFSAVNLGNAWLVAELELEIDPSAMELEIESAAGRVRRQLRSHADEPAPALPSEAPEVADTASPFPGIENTTIRN